MFFTFHALPKENIKAIYGFKLLFLGLLCWGLAMWKVKILMFIPKWNMRKDETCFLQLHTWQFQSGSSCWLYDASFCITEQTCDSEGHIIRCCWHNGLQRFRDGPLIWRVDNLTWTLGGSDCLTRHDPVLKIPFVRRSVWMVSYPTGHSLGCQGLASTWALMNRDPGKNWPH